MIRQLIYDNHQDINDAFVENDDELSISISIKLKREGAVNDVAVTIGFVKERIKQTSQYLVDEHQIPMFVEKGGV